MKQDKNMKRRAAKKADSLIFWARQFAYGGEPKWDEKKRLQCEIHNAKQIAMCTVGELEKESRRLYSSIKAYRAGIDHAYWEQVVKEINLWCIDIEKWGV